MKKMVLASLTALATGGVFAQGYIGGAFGASHVSIDCPANVACKGNDVGFKVYGGAAFTPIVAGEIGYIDFGKLKVDRGSPAYHRTVSGQALTFSVVARAELAPALYGVGRLGLAVVTSTDDLTDTSGSISKSVQSTHPYFGLGLEFAATKELKGVLGLDLTHAEDGYGDKRLVRLLNVGAQYGF